MEKKKVIAWLGGLTLGISLVLFLLNVGSMSPVTAVDAEESNWTAEDYVRTVGNGKVSVEPDEAVLDIGVQTRGAEAQKAVQQNTQRMDKVIQVIKNEGVKEEEIQTQGYYVNEEYNHDPEGRSEVSGYAVTNRVQVTVKQLDAVGQIIDAASEAGANQIGGIRFQLSDEAQAEAEAQALRKATENARNKALVLTESEGRSLGKVLAIDELAGAEPPILFREASQRNFANSESAADMATPIQTGQMEYQVQVSVSYQLK